MKPLELAIQMATTAHEGQTDEDGFVHIVHCMAVMLRAKDAAESNPVPGFSAEEIMVAAVLHDTVEDSEVTLASIQMLFGNKIAEVVDTVSRRKDESYRDFIYRAKANPASRLIKIADLAANRKRTHLISEKKASWRKKLEYKYAIATAVLNDAAEPTWEGASYEVQWEESRGSFRVPRFFIADPNGKKVEITQEEAGNVKISFIVSN